MSRKWRPKKFDEVVGQEHITRSLQNSLARKRVGHAYLLTGTRGIGKTSVARLFAKALRCENLTSDMNACGVCNGCQDFDKGSSLNVFEIDGASNNSVDDIRELVQNVRSLPTFGDYKVYIIDEVHMLSTSAFNALLKTLEEPPAHVVFVFATTEPHKLLSTVMSRCLRFDFRNASVETLFAHVKDICQKENVSVERDSLLEGICEMGEGSFRDTLSLLDQVLSFSETGAIDEASVAMALGMAKEGTITKMLDDIYLGNVEKILETYSGLLRENIEAENICRDLLNQMYKKVMGSNPANAELFWIYESMARDFKWALESPFAEKIVGVVLKKITLRRQFFEASPEQRLEETQEDVEPEEVKPKREFSWGDFLNYVKSNSPGIFTNLEHGNITEKTEVSPSKIFFEIAFPETSGVFYDYLNEKESIQKLDQLLIDYADDPSVETRVILSLLQSEKKTDFKTVAEVDEDKRLNEESRRRENIANESVIKHAQKIFNTQIQEIKLKD